MPFKTESLFSHGPSVTVCIDNRLISIFLPYPSRNFNGGRDIILPPLSSERMTRKCPWRLNFKEDSVPCWMLQNVEWRRGVSLRKVYVSDESSPFVRLLPIVRGNQVDHLLQVDSERPLRRYIDRLENVKRKALGVFQVSHVTFEFYKLILQHRLGSFNIL